MKQTDIRSRESQRAVLAGRAGETLLVPVEDRWRCLPQAAHGAAVAERIFAASWSQDAGESREASCSRIDGYYTVGIALTPATVMFQHEREIVCDGPVLQGSIQVTAPGASVKACHASPCRVMHLFIAPQLLARRYDEAEGQLDPPERLAQSPAIFRDVAIERLALALEAANPLADAFGRVFADSVCDAILARLLCTRTERVSAHASPRRAQLPKWRLRRAIDFIEANLASPIGLADVAASAGLTRMHFAAQFRSTTGYSPHAYLLQRRLEHAQTLLRDHDCNVLDVALSCGFSSHAHFTAVFKRMTGEPPNVWRARIRNGASQDAIASAATATATATALDQIASLHASPSDDSRSGPARAIRRR